MARFVVARGLVCEADEILAKIAALCVVTVFLSWPALYADRVPVRACKCPSCWYLSIYLVWENAQQ